MSGQSIRARTRQPSHGNPEARAWSRRWVPIVVAAVFIIALVSVAISLNRPTIPENIEGLIVHDNLENRAVEGSVDYDIIPPAGGPHAPTSPECGIYNVPVPNEEAVAALATGAVWITYDPGALSEVELDDLMIFAEGELETLMSPYPGQPEPIVVTAWGVQLHPDSPADPRIASFLRDYRNGDQAPASDLNCNAGVVVR